MATDCITFGDGLYHIWRRTVSHLATDCITFGDGLYHIWRRTVSYLATDCIIFGDKSTFRKCPQTQTGQGIQPTAEKP